MARHRYVWREGKLVEISENINLDDLPHNVSQDTMSATWNPVDGKIYDSKSAYRRVLRENNCREIGNEKIVDRVDRSKTPVSQSIREVLRMYEQKPKEVPSERMAEWINEVKNR